MSSDSNGEEEQRPTTDAEEETIPDEAEDESVEISENVKPTFFSEISFCELAYGIGSINLNGLCFGMMLNLPTLTLHNIMYSIAPKGLVHDEVTLQERIHVCKAILDHWMYRTRYLTPKKRFKQIYDAFIALKEKEIANDLKAKFLANEPIYAEMFLKLDIGRLGPWRPPEEPVAPVPEPEYDYEAEEEEETKESEV